MKCVVRIIRGCIHTKDVRVEAPSKAVATKQVKQDKALHANGFRLSAVKFSYESYEDKS